MSEQSDQGENAGDIVRTDLDSHHIPDPQRDTQGRITETRQISMEFSGPLPHPAILKQYAEIDESFPQKLFDMAERRQDHRHNLDIKNLESFNGERTAHYQDKENARKWGAVVICFVIAVCGIAILKGKTIEGISGVLIALGGALGVVLYGQKLNAKTDQESDTE